MDHRKLGRKIGPRIALMRNMVTSLFEHERITTTTAKAKELRRVAERLITLAKKANAIEGDSQEAQAKRLHYKRRAMRVLRKRDVMVKLFDEIAPRYKEREGGYTRIIKLARPRRGDAAEMAIIELVEEETKKEKRRKGKGSK
ncbi:MAG TPA: 50S ribosomal protein L17 [Proteobacteria bacterium]|nr:50S ribosomal protein L17 [Pseudomonadota bacterium]